MDAEFEFRFPGIFSLPTCFISVEVEHGLNAFRVRDLEFFLFSLEVSFYDAGIFVIEGEGVHLVLLLLLLLLFCLVCFLYLGEILFKLLEIAFSSCW